MHILQPQGVFYYLKLVNTNHLNSYSYSLREKNTCLWSHDKNPDIQRDQGHRANGKQLSYYLVSNGVNSTV